MLGTEAQKLSVLPLLLEGTPEIAPPLLNGRVYSDFREAAVYFTRMFDLTSLSTTEISSTFYSSYSSRKAVMGSTRMARRAGT